MATFNNKLLVVGGIMLKLLVLIIIGMNVRTAKCTSAEFLWKVINTTIERKTPSKDAEWNPSNCPRLIFHNNETLAPTEFTGIKSVAVDLTNINEQNFTFPSMEQAKQFLSSEVKLTIELGDLALGPGSASRGDPTMKKLYEPCITVVSVVNSSNMVFDKLEISGQMIQLLQFNTPIRNRHLILVRLADKDEELFDCAVFKGASDFPTRKMSTWEMLLFDFFTDARVIQGLALEYSNKAKNTLRVGTDPGIWVWLCDDIIQALEEKKRCLAMHKPMEECRIWKRLADEYNKTCTTGYSPRH